MFAESLLFVCLVKAEAKEAFPICIATGAFITRSSVFELKLTPCTGCVIGYTVCCDAAIADDSAPCFSKQESHDSRALDFFPYSE